ncbi:hypothetical protein AS026_26535 [Rhizobium altiplani]|uniref:Uncharacterized protein n=1 Tax=Rhizobium altiplani TaxID=1864509 RepID=A0A109J0R9_9HYPH|nr:hypothetical protein AS026_26535 [Rhizobium altiplani]
MRDQLLAGRTEADSVYHFLSEACFFEATDPIVRYVHGFVPIEMQEAAPFFIREVSPSDHAVSSYLTGQTIAQLPVVCRSGNTRANDMDANRDQQQAYAEEVYQVGELAQARLDLDSRYA